MAVRKRHSPEEVVRKLTLADRLLSEGKDVPAVCRELQISEATYHRWRNQFGGLKADDAKRLKELEKENGTLKSDCRRPTLCIQDAVLLFPNVERVGVGQVQLG